MAGLTSSAREPGAAWTVAPPRAAEGVDYKEGREDKGGSRSLRLKIGGRWMAPFSTKGLDYLLRATLYQFSLFQ